MMIRDYERLMELKHILSVLMLLKYVKAKCQHKKDTYQFPCTINKQNKLRQQLHQKTLQDFGENTYSKKVPQYLGGNTYSKMPYKTLEGILTAKKSLNTWVRILTAKCLTRLQTEYLQQKSPSILAWEYLCQNYQDNVYYLLLLA